MPVDLKRNSHEKQGTMLGVAASDDEENDYAYGLSLHLEAPELQKVPLTADMVGTTIPMEILARVESFTDSEEGKSASIQVRAIGLKAEAADEAPTRASALYD